MSGCVRIVPLEGSGVTGDELAGKHLAIRRGQVEDGENEFPDVFESQDDLRRAEEVYAAPGGFWVALDSAGRLVGFVGLKAGAPGLAFLKRLAVDRSMRGQGLGTELVGVVMRHARLRRFTLVGLSTGVRERARPIYVAHGFVTVRFDRERQDYVMVCPVRRISALPSALAFDRLGETSLVPA